MALIDSIITAVLLGSIYSADDPGSIVHVSPQSTVETPQQNLPPVQLEDVLVTGRPLDELVGTFVREVAAPNRGRGLARWRNGVCVGVANLRSDIAQHIVDRVSTVASDVGLDAGRPGCEANILIIATGDGNALAADLTGTNFRAFRAGGSGMDRGGEALADFVRSDRAVRWWQVSLPVNDDNGERAVRLPGECRNDCTDADDAAPIIKIFAASRLRTQIVDNIMRTIVIVDVDQVSQVPIEELSDYIAMVSLAQIDPDADTTGYASVLNLFSDYKTDGGITEWDKSFLDGLYSAERNNLNHRSDQTEIVSSILDAHQQIRDTRSTEIPD